MVNRAIAIVLYKTAPVPPPKKWEEKQMIELEAIPTELPNIAVVEEKVADSIEIGEDEEEIQIRSSSK